MIDDSKIAYAAVAATAGALLVTLLAVASEASGAVVFFAALTLIAALVTAALAGGAHSGEARSSTRTDGPSPGANLENEAWLALVEDSIALLDELERHRESFDAQGKRIADHVALRVREILERSSIEVIDDAGGFDRSRHAPIEGASLAHPGTAIDQVVSPGFAAGPRVLRRAKVRLRTG